MRKLLAHVIWFMVLSVALSGCACNMEEVPPTHIGMEFRKSKTGNSDGFSGTVRQPGSYSLDLYSTMPLIQCKEETVREQFKSPAKDGVEFGTDVYVRFSANCGNEDAAKWIFKNVQPEPGLKVRETQTTNEPKPEEKKERSEDYSVENYDSRTVTAYQLHTTYLRPLIGNAIRDAISTYPSDEINSRRDEIAKAIVDKVQESLKRTFEESDRPAIVKVYEVTLSKIDFPDKMMELNEQLANKKTQIKIEEEELRKVKAQIETEKMQKDLEKVKAEKSVQEIQLIGKIIRENPEYLQYLQVTQQPKALEALGKGGSTFVFGSVPDFMRAPVREVK